MCDSKLVIVSESGFKPQYQSFIQDSISQGCELFSIVGRDSRQWDEAIQSQVDHMGLTGYAVSTLCFSASDLDEAIQKANAYPTFSAPCSEADVVYL